LKTVDQIGDLLRLNPLTIVRIDPHFGSTIMRPHFVEDSIGHGDQG